MKNYSRTPEPYTLNEVLYIMFRLHERIPVQEIAEDVERSPEALTYKFLEYRAKNKDGTYSRKTVPAYQAME